MKIEEIIEKARVLGINSKNKNKLELVHEIQQKEGYESCYSSLRRNCSYSFECCFAEDCLRESTVRPIFIFEVV